MIPGALPCPKCGTAEKVEYVGLVYDGVACTDDRHDEEPIHASGRTLAEALASWNRYVETCEYGLKRVSTKEEGASDE